ncbi:MAG TPA: isoprenylcysteine carboxylmethyltransferase family protein [Candidatus Acidoferrales bacterium]|nr:isoprenylcysteine carboxylmethyltransferase family protein [Candidatus Acidoferrales bacterium]
MKHLNLKALAGLLVLLAVMAAALFIPVWTLNYWEAWVFLIIFFGSAFTITIDLMRKDPKLLERRITVGPTDEKETSQKIIQLVAQFAFLLIIIFPVLDHRFGWSVVPVYVDIIGDILVAIGFYIVFIVFKENTYASALIEVGKGQKIISTGPYAWVRHPMYIGALILLLGTPLALGSLWGVFTIIPITLVIIWRLLDEERFLTKNLPGYAEYKNKVGYRLVPFAW